MFEAAGAMDCLDYHCKVTAFTLMYSIFVAVKASDSVLNMNQFAIKKVTTEQLLEHVMLPRLTGRI